MKSKLMFKEKQLLDNSANFFSSEMRKSQDKLEILKEKCSSKNPSSKLPQKREVQSIRREKLKETRRVCSELPIDSSNSTTWYPQIS